MRPADRWVRGRIYRHFPGFEFSPHLKLLLVPPLAANANRQHHKLERLETHAPRQRRGGTQKKVAFTSSAVAWCYSVARSHRSQFSRACVRTLQKQNSPAHKFKRGSSMIIQASGITLCTMAKYDPRKHHRHSICLLGYDRSTPMPRPTSLQVMYPN